MLLSVSVQCLVSRCLVSTCNCPIHRPARSPTVLFSHSLAQSVIATQWLGSLTIALTWTPLGTNSSEVMVFVLTSFRPPRILTGLAAALTLLLSWRAPLYCERTPQVAKGERWPVWCGATNESVVPAEGCVGCTVFSCVVSSSPRVCCCGCHVSRDGLVRTPISDYRSLDRSSLDHDVRVLR